MEGVVQGDNLIPTLFIQYIADFLNFLKDKRLLELSIKLRDLSALLFADDAVFFASLLIEAKRILSALEEYFDKNKLTVYTGKSQIIICQIAGRIRKTEQKAFFYIGHPI